MFSRSHATHTVYVHIPLSVNNPLYLGTYVQYVRTHDSTVQCCANMYVLSYHTCIVFYIRTYVRMFSCRTLASDSDNSTVTTLTGGEEVPGELQTDIPEDLDSTLHAEEEEDSGNKVVETDIVDETQTLSHSQIQTFSGVTTEEDDTVDKVSVMLVRVTTVCV